VLFLFWLCDRNSGSHAIAESSLVCGFVKTRMHGVCRTHAFSASILLACYKDPWIRRAIE
jgi:hypothetical protein